MTDSLIYLMSQIVANEATSHMAWYQEPITILTFLIVVILGNFFAFYKIVRDLKHQQMLFIEGQNLKERDDIRHRLNKFYGPFKELRAESIRIYDVFALDLKAAEKSKGNYFRTLRFLAEGGEFDGPDKTLLKEILKIEIEQLKLMEMEGWAVDNPRLAELLGQLGAHIRILSLAETGNLTGRAAELEEMVFPPEVDGAIETEIRKLQDRYQALLKTKTYDEPRSRLDEDQEKTLKYYDEHASKYYQETANLDLSEVYDKFREVIPRGATVLDAGCGVGRDTRYFIRHGYRVVAFDASKKMVEMCQQYPFAYCLNMSFDDVGFIEEFDGVWANASLIHVSPKTLPSAMLRLVNATKPGGVLYISTKESPGSAGEDGRTFYHHKEGEVDNIALGQLSLEKIGSWTNKSKKASDKSLWTNLLYWKPKLAVKN